ncbi:MAG TPA: hypothetical protein VNN22_10725 [Verrucomicrobiae bacterium]|nr:hypothetical protein [Verrucomicrobiae bacterium]
MKSTILFLTLCLTLFGCSTTETHSKDATPEEVWNNMKASLKAGNINGAVSYFSVASRGDYRETFRALSKQELKTDANGMGILKASSVEGDKAQYYFESNVDGTNITFPVEFVKEDGKWKIMEY